MSTMQNRKTAYLLIMVFVLLAGIFTQAVVKAETVSGLLDGKTFLVERAKKQKGRTH